jgi:hypothetical protein
MSRQRTGVRGRGSWDRHGVRLTVIVLGVMAATAAAANQPVAIDDFSSIAAWRAVPSQGVSVTLARDPDGPALRVDFDFHGGAGWAAFRRPVDLDLPPNYEITFRVRGDAPVNNLELKLVDSSGDNVWWCDRRDFVFPRDWQLVRTKKRQISFAWGPAAGGELRHVAAIELAITAGSGGRGTVWIEALKLTPLPPAHPYIGTPILTASSSDPDHGPGLAMDGQPSTSWHGAAADGEPWLAVDFGERRELGGLVIDWDGPAYPTRYDVETSDDGRVWTPAHRAATCRGGRSYVPMPETDTRFLRLLLHGPPAAGVGIREVAVQPLEFATTPNAFIASVARDAPRGVYPRAFLGEMTSWALVGLDGGARDSALLSRDGAFEPEPGSFSIEPFVELGGRLLGWADATSEQSLPGGDLPIPTVTLHFPAADLEVTACAWPVSGETSKLLRYRLTNRSAAPLSGRLVMAVRPFQVNPPSQFLNTAGGVAPLTDISLSEGSLTVDGGPVLRPLSPPSSSGAVAFDNGDILAVLRACGVQSGGRVRDSAGYASAMFSWEVALAPGAARTVWLEVLPSAAAIPTVPLDPARWAEESLAAAGERWGRTLGGFEIDGPREVAELSQAMRANLAFILLSRDGAALEPGTRSYARSWIRDGAMMAAALLRLGHTREVRDYILWFAPFQFGDGKVPCCVDHRGADPVPENDSAGEFLFLVGEYLRFSGDTQTAAEVWPHVERAVTYLDGLRRQGRSDAIRNGPDRAFYGLLPASISHEGYSAKPMHSYWDDLWAVRGLADAARVARALGHEREAARWQAIRGELLADVLASMEEVRHTKGLLYLPGCAELGDFDPTSSTVALWPAEVGARLPAHAVAATWERYWGEAEARFTGRTVWQNYTPYEWRNVDAFVRLGWRERALALSRWLMADRLPPGWNGWPEIVWCDLATARFLGDLPHAWVGSDFIRSFLDMLVYERADRDELVLGAGLQSSWLSARGVSVAGVHTPWGPIAYTVRVDGDVVHWSVPAGCALPAGGLVLTWPLEGRPTRATVNGTPVTPGRAGEVVLRTVPAEVEVRQ